MKAPERFETSRLVLRKLTSADAEAIFTRYAADPEVNDFNTIRDILKPYDATLMRRYPVSRKLNNSKIDDAESASPVTLDTPTQGQLF